MCGGGGGGGCGDYVLSLLTLRAKSSTGSIVAFEQGGGHVLFLWYMCDHTCIWIELSKQAHLLKLKNCIISSIHCFLTGLLQVLHH